MTLSGSLTLLLNDYGKPFASGNSFGNWLKARCLAAGLSQCSAHGLRKAGATIAAEQGAPDVELEAMYGWTNNRQSGVYTKAARNRTLASNGYNRIADFLVLEGVLRGRTENEKSLYNEKTPL